ncbi:cadherin-like domain-containing protein [Bacteriovoracaceae bacterium]|nr:cadherin-like domain-containing protein [Bacteriovoracaceae bacterium]
MIDSFDGRTIGVGVYYEVDFNDSDNDFDIDGDAISYQCYYDQTVSDNVSSSTTNTCESLDNVTFNTSSGVLVWETRYPQSGDYEFKIVATDGRLQDDHIFTIYVDPFNTAPVINNNPCSTTSNQSELYSCTPTATDTNQDNLTWEIDATNTCAWASINSSSGKVTGTPDDSEVGSCDLKFKVQDQVLAYSSIETTSITVANVAPTLSIDDPSDLTEDSAITVISSNSDVESNEEGFGVYSIIAASSDDCSSSGTVAIDTSTGAVSFTPTLNFDDNCNINVQFDDQNASSNTVSSEFNLTMIPVNDAPVISATCTTSLNERIAYSCTPSIVDPDDSTFNWTTTTNTCSGWLSIAAGTGVLSGTPVGSDVGVCQVIFKATETDADSTDSNSITVNITVGNVAPVVNASDQNLNEDAGLTEIINDAGVTCTDEGYGTYSIIASSGTDCQSKGAVSINSTTGALSFNPTANFDTNCNINIQFNDGEASNNLGTKEITVTMNASNDPPVISKGTCPTEASTTNSNEDVAIDCTPSVTDPDTGDTSTWSLGGNHSCSFITASEFTTASGRIQVTPDDDDVPVVCLVELEVTDSTANTDTFQFTYDIDNVTPTLTTFPSDLGSASPITATADVVVLMNAASAEIVTTAEIVSSDETFGSFSIVSSTGSPDCQSVSTISINATTGAVTFAPNADEKESCYVKVQFDDDNGGVVTDEFEIYIHDTVAPTIVGVTSNDADTTYAEGSTIRILVEFDESVTINTTGGTPRLFLETGDIDQQIDFVIVDSGKLAFDYTVGPDDASSDLDIHATVNELEVNGAVISDDFGNVAVSFPIVTGAANVGALANSKDLVIDASSNDATLTDTPMLLSPDYSLNVLVGGTNIVEYKHKIGVRGTVDCNDSSGYSGDTVIATRITDVLGAYANGTLLRLCVVGKNVSGNYQSYTDPTIYDWARSIYSIAKVDFSNVTNVANWADAEIDPDNSNIIYARNLLGEVYKSEDTGTTWDLYCTRDHTTNSRIEVSPGPDRTPYLIQDGKLYNIEEVADRGVCPEITLPTTFETTYHYASIAFAKNGDFIIWNTDNYYNTTVNRSNDQGASFTQISLQSYFGTELRFAFDPNDNQKINYVSMISCPACGTANVGGSYESTDNGATWNLLTTSYFGTNSASYYIGYYADPLDSDYIYSNYNYITDDNGASFTASSSHVPLQARFDFNNSNGKAYKLVTSGSDTLLQEAATLATASPTWSTIATISGSTGDVTRSMNVSVSVNSTTGATESIAIILDGSLFISSDGGSSFNEHYAPETLRLWGVSTYAGDTVYGATKDWNVIKSTDDGDTWSYIQNYTTHCANTPPRVYSSFGDDQKVIVWADNLTTTTTCGNALSGVNFEGNFMSTSDGMTSAEKNSHLQYTSYYKSLAININNGTEFSFVNDNTTYFSGDFGNSWNKSFSGPSLSSLHPDSFIHPENSYVHFLLNTSGNGTLYSFDTKTAVATTIATPLGTLAGIDMFNDYSDGLSKLRVISKTGELYVSDDHGASFTAEAADPSFTSCTKRFLKHDKMNPNVIATICLNEEDLSFSVDNGDTWDTINLGTTYSYDCNSRGISLTNNKIYVSCASGDTIRLHYMTILYNGDTADGIIDDSEKNNATDLIDNTVSGKYTGGSRYAIINVNDVCDATVNFAVYGATIPQTNDLTVDGTYQVCVELTDGGADISYQKGPPIRRETANPTFTSLTLINEASDNAISLLEYQNSFSPIVSDVVGTNFDSSLYLVALSTDTCSDASLSSYYKSSRPLLNDLNFKNSETYKVCVKLSNENTDVYDSSANFTLDLTTVDALLTNLPDPISTNLALNIQVSGENITHYQYVIGNGIDCEAATYSADVPVGTNITTDTTAYSGSYTLCVIGRDTNSIYQLKSLATEYTWIHQDDDSIRLVNFNNTSDPLWQKFVIHPSDTNIVYAVDRTHAIYKSEDAGTTWQHFCIADRVFDNLIISADDGKAYYENTNDLYRVEQKGLGEYCTNTTSLLSGSVLGTSYYTSFDLTPTGIIYMALQESYALEGTGTTKKMTSIWRSVNKGLSWVYLSSLDDVYPFHVEIDPNDEANIFISTDGGLYKSNDYALSFSLESGSITSASSIFVDENNSNNIWSSANYLSTDNGDSWSSTTLLDSASMTYDLDSGNAYRLKSSGSDTILQKTTNLTTPSWSTINTFVNVQSSSVNNEHLSVNGTNISVAINGEGFYSTDTGANFSSQDYLGTYQQITDFTSTDGQNIFAVSRQFYVFNSTDAGASWQSPADLFYTGDSSQTTSSSAFRALAIKVNPLNNNNIMVFPYSYAQGHYSSTNNLIYTNDGFTSYSTASSSVVLEDIYDSGAFSYHPFQEDYAGFLSTAYLRETRNLGSSITSNYGIDDFTNFDWRGNSVWTKDTNFYMAINTSNNLYRINISDGTPLLITSNLSTVTTPVALESVNDKSQQFIKVYNRTGIVDYSTDNGVTWASYSAGTFSSSCSTSVEVKALTYFNNPDIVAVSCGQTINFSTDAGASWSAYDLSDVCQRVGGMALTNSKIFVACIYSTTEYESRYALELNFKKVNLTADAIDGLIDFTEDGNTTDIVTVEEDHRLSSIEYAIIVNGANCDAGVTFSATVPDADDFAAKAKGEYQICLKYDDGSTQYESSSVIYYNDASPVFTSIDLTNGAADLRVDYQDFLNDEDIITNLVATNYESALYVLVTDVTSCNSNTLDYQYDIPTTSQLTFSDISETDYKVCVKLVDSSNLFDPTYDSSSTFTFNPEFFMAELSGAPNEVSTSVNLNITVGGTGITNYSYKYGDNTLDCTDSASYSANRVIATPITDAIVNTNNKLCVLGLSADLDIQPLTSPTQYEWIYNANLNIDKTNFSGVSTDDLGHWLSAAVHEFDNSIIYASDNLGQIFKTIDNGTNWNFVCKYNRDLDDDKDHLFHFSKSDLNDVYFTTEHEAYYIDANDGYSCTQITTGVGDLYNEYNRASFSVGIDGILYSMAHTGVNNINLYNSTDKGTSWTLVSNFTTLGHFGGLRASRNQNKILSYYSSADDGAGSAEMGFKRSKNNGASFSNIEESNSDINSTQTANIINSINDTKLLISNFGRYSTDDGKSWSAYDSDLEFDEDFAIDGSNNIYYLQDSSDDTILYQSTSYAAPSFASFYTFSDNSSSNLYDNKISINDTIFAAMVNGYLYISSNTGSTFTKINWPGRFLLIDSVASEDNSNLFVATNDWNIFDSSNLGTTYSEFYKLDNIATSCLDRTLLRTNQDHDGLYIFADRLDNSTATNCNTILGIADPLGAATVSNFSSLVAAGSSIFSLNVNSQNAIMLGNDNEYVTSDSGNSWASDVTTFTNSSNYLGIEGYIDTNNSNLLWTINLSDNFVEYDASTDAETNITGNLNIASIAGIDMYYSATQSDFVIRAISNDGVIDEAINDVSVFNVLANSGTITSCSSDRRRLKNLRSNEDIVITACINEDLISYSIDAGDNWTEINLSSYGITCSIRDIALVDLTGGNYQAIMSCQDNYSYSIFF